LRELGRLTLSELLELTILIALDPRRYPRVAARWLRPLPRSARRGDDQRRSVRRRVPRGSRRPEQPPRGNGAADMAGRAVFRPTRPRRSVNVGPEGREVARRRRAEGIPTAARQPRKARTSPRGVHPDFLLILLAISPDFFARASMRCPAARGSATVAGIGEESARD
jgi:hypothetical protein